ncbi:MAG: 4-phosphoerythronate dehydrogenase [Gammaproteobacteria bacterium]|jgi:erythronate-4-phosphate dehydrogenase|nr:4-phosphoerythronate dehydrogenase [Gammaproteobacteria bacterium]
MNANLSSMGKINIIADENISGLEYFEKLAIVSKVSGRSLSSEIIQNADALLVRSVSNVNESLLNNSSIKFIASATSGIDHVDVNYLQENNIQFAHAPGSNANSVVQYVFASFAFLSKKYDFDWRELSIGIIGAGKVGGLLADYLDKLNIDCVIYDPFLGESHPHSDKFVSFEKVLEQDLFSVHTPLTKEGPYPTWHLFNEKVIEALNKGSIMINTSRGAVFDNQTLHSKYKNKSWKCVLDVWENEPDIFLPLLNQVDIGTSHIAGYSYEGKEQGTAQIYQAFVDYFELDEAQTYPINNENKLLKFANSDSELNQINQAILAAYPIEYDYKKLLELDVDIPTSSFDGLRKNYPLRREFQYYRLDYSSITSNAEKTLRCLGFN